MQCGYLNLENTTKEKFINIVNPFTDKLVRAYKTGDIVKLNNNLELEFIGRTDDMVKVNGGYLVSINEVEAKIQKLLGENFEICVICSNFKSTKALILYVSSKKIGISIDIEDIAELVKENITFYMNPKTIIPIDTIPRNQNGKIDRKKLKSKIDNNRLDTDYEYVLPENKTEKEIYEKVKKIVKTDFSIIDDFEDNLGIDSLNIATLYSLLRNMDIEIQDLYNYSTVKDLAYMIDKNIKGQEKNNLSKIKIRNDAKKFDLTNVLLTGATGFLGVHLLKELALNKITKKIYCTIRTKLDITSEERFENIIQYYFDKEICKKIREKAIIIDADSNKEGLGLKNKELNEITTIINSAANVKHIGKYNRFYKDNVQSVKNIIKICKEHNISLAHISTLSVAGFKNEKIKNKIFDENIVDVGQSFNKNPYLMSKMEAELEILSSNINVKIFRTGNIMPRKEDNKFQINYEQSAFINAIKTLKDLKIYAREMLNIELKLTPVDECSMNIVKILEKNLSNNVYHIESNKPVRLGEIVKMMGDFEEVDFMTLKDELTKNYTMSKEYLSSLFSNSVVEYKVNNLDNKWSNLSKEYLAGLIAIMNKL